MEPQASGGPELAHVLFLDIVGCSKLPSDEQQRIIGRLQELVWASGEYQRAQAKEQVISLPTGDGMALVFFNKLDAAVLCAVEITRSIQAESLCRIRMGLHSGPVFVMEDINHKRNVSGAGINLAERVMSCGTAGHILLSEHAAESLRHLSVWRDKITNIGECQVKDGWIRVWNLVDGPIGNPDVPRKSRRFAQRRRRVIGGGIAALALAVTGSLAGAFWLGRGVKSSPAIEEKSIAVLPFADLSPETNKGYFSDGLAEELLDELVKVPGWRVVGKTSSSKFKGANEDARTIGRRLNVATILEGSVRWEGTRTKISVRLIEAADGVQRWSESFTRQTDKLLSVQEDIAKAVTGALRIVFLAKQAGQTASEDAFKANLQGRYLLGRRSEENLRKAAGFFEQAIQLDRGYARAWLGLGTVRFRQAGSEYIPQKEGFEKARDAASQALVLDPSGGEAHALIGAIQRQYWDWNGASMECQRALELEPGNAEVIRAAANMAKTLGRLDEAIGLDLQAIRIDPLSPGGYQNAGIVLYNAGRYDEAVARLKKALELAPENEVTHGMLAEVYLAQSKPEEALAEAKQEKEPSIQLLGLAMAYHKLGRKAESDASVAALLRKFQKDDPFTIAEVYAFRGEKDQAFEWLERACNTRDAGLTELKGDPLLKSLESDPRYAKLLVKMGLPR